MESSQRAINKLPTFSPAHGSRSRQAPNPPDPDTKSKPKHHRHHSHRALLHPHFHHGLYLPEEAWLHEHLGAGRSDDWRQSEEQRDLGTSPSAPREKHRRLRPHRRHRSHDGRLRNRVAKRDMLTEEATGLQESSRPTGSGQTSLGIDGESGMDDLVRLPFVRREQYLQLEDVEREREKRKEAEKSNSVALSSIADRSITFSQRLDTAYYNLLDRLSSIRATIQSFHNLRNLTISLNSDFNDEAAALVQDTRKQLADFQDFTPQIRKIEALEGRMQNCREKALQLDQRLATVRQQIEAWDRKEVEWQRRISRRLRILWAVMGTALLLVAIAGLVGRFRPASIPGRVQVVGRSKAGAGSLHANMTLCPDGARCSKVMTRDKSLGQPCFNDFSDEDSCQSSRSGAPTGGSQWKDPEEKIQRVLDEL